MLLKQALLGVVQGPDPKQKKALIVVDADESERSVLPKVRHFDIFCPSLFTLLLFTLLLVACLYFTSPPFHHPNVLGHSPCGGRCERCGLAEALRSTRQNSYCSSC
jgi:hypothetical protein